MHPALSIILFSTLSGAGFGLGAVLGMTGFPDGSPVLARYPLFAPAMAAILLASSGLVSSVFHLRRPERAWRAFSQWKSSWLSREGILSVAAMASLTGLAMMPRVDSPAVIMLGMAAFLLCGLAVFSTAMIYRQLRSVPAWSSALTPLLYVSFALASGLLAASVLAAGFAVLAEMQQIYRPVAQLNAINGLATAAAAGIVLAWIVQTAWWKRMRRVGMGESTPETATRLEKFGKVRLLESPHTESNYLLDEMGFVVGRRHASRLRLLALLFGGLLPITCLGMVQMSDLPSVIDFTILLLALIIHLVGVCLSRWLFFAEAQHTVTLYY